MLFRSGQPRDSACAGLLTCWGFSFLLDFQGDVLEEQTLFGIRETARSTLILRDSPRDEWGLVLIEIRDRGGRAFVAEARTSDSRDEANRVTALRFAT